MKCSVTWQTGSTKHGCELPAQHKEPHYCGDEAGPCSGMTLDGRIRYYDDATREWHESIRVKPRDAYDADDYYGARNEYDTKPHIR